MNTKQLIFIDLDGTLLNDEKSISPYTLSVLKKLQSRPDYILCIASGRPFIMTKYYLHLLDIHTPVITNNAANISLGLSGSLLYQKCLPITETSDFLRYCEANQLDWAIFFSDCIYSSPTPERLTRYTEYNQKLMTAGFDPLKHIIINPEDEASPILEIGAERLSILVHTDEEHQIIQDYFKTHFNLHCIRSTPESYDIVHPDIDKWTGIQFISAYYNIPISNVYAFGNDRNDLQMIKNCPHSFAVSNAELDILNNASCIIDSNNNDGVAKAITQYILNK